MIQMRLMRPDTIRWWRRLAPGIAALLLLASALPARADDDADTEVAKRYFRQGVDLYARNEYEKALALFERAKLARPLPEFDFNIALCNDRLGRWTEALAAYERFSVTSSKPAHIKEATDRIAVLRTRVQTASHRATADEHYRKAVADFNAGAFAAAAAKFKLAYQTVPDPVFLYSAAHAFRRAGDTSNAIRHFEEFLKAAPQSPQRVAVELRLKELKSGRPLKPTDPNAAPSARLDAVAALIKTHRPAFRACFDQWATRHPTIGGQVDLSFFLDPDGAIQQVEAQPRGFDAPEVAACIVKFAQTLTYPPAPNGKYTRFRYPFDFKPK